MQKLTTLDLTDRQFLKIRAEGIGGCLIFWRVVELKTVNRFSSRLRPRRTVRREIRADVWERLVEASPAIVLEARISNVIGEALAEFRRRDRAL